MQECVQSGEFVFAAPEADPVGSVLYEEHLKLASKSRMSAFAGYLMPLWYSSIAAEHQAVRTAAGLFDCTHMGVLEVSGGGAAEFLNTVATNDIERLRTGRAQYSYVLDAAGNALDDIIVYRRDADNFMVVVNAVNEPKIKRYFGDVLAGRVVIDTDPYTMGFEPSQPCVVRDMRDPATGTDCRVDVALQGPASADVLAALSGDPSTRARLLGLKRFAFVAEQVAGIDCLISTTGYTGATTGFELFVHPQQAARLWNAILEAGKPLGVLPCGLGARDSLRIEAGLPLYGHESSGKFGISPFEAGYGWAVKLDKEFFIGKAAMERVAETYKMQVVRVQLPAAKGIRPVRPDDPVLDRDNACVGSVLSAATAGDKQYAQVFVSRSAAREGNTLGFYYLARSASQVQQGRKEHVEKGQQAQADLTGTVVSRFGRF